MNRLIAALFAIVLAVPAAAQVQKFSDVAQQLDGLDQPRPSRAPLRVQVSYQLQVPVDHDASVEDQKTAIASIHDALYDLAGHECDHLQAAFRMECRLASITVGNAGQGYGNANTMSATASAGFDLSPLPPTPPPPKP